MPALSPGGARAAKQTELLSSGASWTRCRERMNGQWHRIGPLDELAAGRVTVRSLGGRDLALCHTSEGVFAVEDLCTHAETPLSHGRLRGCRLVCPLHGASFDVRDGRVLGGPASAPLPTYPVRIHSGQVEVLLPDPDPLP